jgi:hypothetical protein
MNLNAEEIDVAPIPFSLDQLTTNFKTAQKVNTLARKAFMVLVHET